MRHDLRIVFSILLMLAIPPMAAARTLKEIYDASPPGGGYDKYVVLQTGEIYTGGLLIGPILSPITHDLEGEPGRNVRIVGNGAILDLQGEQICISYCTKRLDIDDCIVVNGDIRYRGMNTFDHVELPIGFVRHVTFYTPHDYGIRIQGAGTGITLERNLVVDAVDTGWDFIYTNGSSNDWLPTGANISFSVQEGFYGTPIIRENWTYHSDPVRNATPLAHFSRLCEYG